MKKIFIILIILFTTMLISAESNLMKRLSLGYELSSIFSFANSSRYYDINDPISFVDTFNHLRLNSEIDLINNECSLTLGLGFSGVNKVNYNIGTKFYFNSIEYFWRPGLEVSWGYVGSITGETTFKSVHLYEGGTGTYEGKIDYNDLEGDYYGFTLSLSEKNGIKIISNIFSEFSIDYIHLTNYFDKIGEFIHTVKKEEHALNNMNYEGHDDIKVSYDYFPGYSELV